MKATTDIKVGDRVAGGTPGTDDYDEGRVDEIRGDKAIVSWDSLVVTPAPLEELTKID